MGSAQDFVFTFSFETLDDALNRGMMRPPDRVLQSLLTRDDVGDVLVAEPYRSRPIQLVRGVVDLRRKSNAPRPPVPPDHILRPRRLRRKDPTSIGEIDRWYRRYDDELRRAVSRLGLVEPVVITFHPLIAGFAPMPWARRAVFYVRDDWAAFPPHRAWWPAYEEAYQRIRNRRRAVCAVSQVLLDRIAPTGPSCVIPNGVSPDEWIAPTSSPDWFDRLARPRLVYVGSLDDRLDTDAIATVARRFPDASVALIGPMFDPAHLATLDALANVIVHEHLARSELTAVVSHADACLIPHRQTALTEAMSPLKLFEYLAAGRPVVATDLKPMRGHGDRVILVQRGGDFGRAVSDALALPPQTEAQRLDYVAENSWQARHDQLFDLALGDDA